MGGREEDGESTDVLRQILAVGASPEDNPDNRIHHWSSS